MKLLLALIASLSLSVPARAWEASADDADARLHSYPSFTRSHQNAMPGWARRIRAPEDKVHWSETRGGKTYVFGVGMARGVENPALRLGAAEDRARASIVDRVGEVTTSTATSSGGAVIRVKTAVLNGARIIDWFLGPSGDLYALAVLEQQP